MFTPDEIKAIEALIDKKIAAFKTVQPVKLYYSVPEIRALILQTLPELMDMVGTQEFPLSFIRWFLRNRTTCLPDDDVIFRSDGRNTTQTRFDSQVSGALNTNAWPNCPIKKVGRGIYQLTISYD